ncbi:hypothetical protein LJ756_00155 [Arthrobacter sp. zg-Y411]|uniref:hypothetical protein n=1 Tax=Arthrobacter zhangbolii TaxID=2886936 RepID=UPI001D158931|nr:hypothetical protein [Arthrobacter zhangbolii]MCC3293033.1 hypothetical protein [Arthrobacter zhangbolii]
MEGDFTFSLTNEPLTWSIPARYRIEGHGHSFVLVSRRSRPADLLLEANAPLKLRFGTEPAGMFFKYRRVTLVGAPGTEVTVRIGHNLVADRGVGAPGSGWKVWHGPRQLTYFLEEPLTEAGKNKLCVAFSAIGAPYNFTYNYRSSLAPVDSYRLYVLDDFGSRGSYYYADHRDRSIFSAVQSFLQELAANLAISPADMVFLGSSKGGAAALVHGLRLGAGQILAGAPQCFPGAYLRGAAPEILNFIAGNGPDDPAEWLDRMLPDAIGNIRGNPAITLLVGEKDSHRHVHVEPFVKMAATAGLQTRTLVVKNVSHKDIGRAFGPYVKAILRPGADRAEKLIPYQLAPRDGEANTVQLRLWLPAGEVAAVEVWTPEERIHATGFSPETYFQFHAPAGQPVRAKITRRCEAKSTELSFATEWLTIPE